MLEFFCIDQMSNAQQTQIAWAQSRANWNCLFWDDDMVATLLVACVWRKHCALTSRNFVVNKNGIVLIISLRSEPRASHNTTTGSYQVDKFIFALLHASQTNKRELRCCKNSKKQQKRDESSPKNFMQVDGERWDKLKSRRKKGEEE